MGRSVGTKLIEKRKKMSELIKITFPKTAGKQITGKNGKAYCRITVPQGTEYAGYTFIWPPDKVKTDWNDKNNRVIFLGDDYEVTIKKFLKNEENRYAETDSVTLKAEDVSDIMKHYYIKE